MSFSFKASAHTILARALPFIVAAGLVIFSAGAWDFSQLEQLARLRYGPTTERLTQDLGRVLAEARGRSEADKLKRVNDFFNRRLRFASDQEIWGQEDYWATPLEFIGKGAGDCEDFSIAKYFSLRQLGVSKEKLRLTYVRARIGGPSSRISQAHMVLTYYPTPDAEPLVLDNLIGSIRPASSRPDLTPVYSFNTDGVYTGSGARPAAPVERLSRWKDLLAKMQAEGMEP